MKVSVFELLAGLIILAACGAFVLFLIEVAIELLGRL